MQISSAASSLGASALQKLFQPSTNTGQIPPGAGKKPPGEAGACAPSTPGASIADKLLEALLDIQKAPPSSDELADKLIKKLDKDGDGALSADEIKSALAGAGDDASNVDKIFAALDQDGDGTLGADEVTKALSQRAPPPDPFAAISQAALGAADTNKDGVLSQDEILAAIGADNADTVSKTFASLDTNGDGALNLNEITSALQTQQRQAGLAAYARQQDLTSA